jgi:phospholipid-binding lipoprotein MlaA
VPFDRLPFPRRAVLGASAAGLLLAGCASVSGAAAPGTTAAAPAVAPRRHDPFEGLNRGFFRLGDVIDRGLVHPILAGYRRLAPRPVRRAVHNVVTNLDEPVIFINDVLQAHPKTAAKTAVRFFANSTVGVGGIFDAAATAGIPHHDNGFGSTLGRWGVGPGPYFYLPLLGPTTLRDVTGDAVDWVSDPFSWLHINNARSVGFTEAAVSLLDEREQADAELRALKNTAVDPYATLRSAYLQSRAAEVKGGETELEPLPELPEPPPSVPAPAPEAAPQTAPGPTTAPPPAEAPPLAPPSQPPSAP